MDDYTAIFKALAHLTSQWSPKIDWHSEGMDVEFHSAFFSEFLPNMRFYSGHCRLPGAKLPIELKRKSFLIQTGTVQAIAHDWTPFTTLTFWANTPKDSADSQVELKWVEQNQDVSEYFSLDINDQMLSGTPYSPYTDRYLVKKGNITIGKIRVTDCGDNIALTTRPYLMPQYKMHEEKLLTALGAALYKKFKRNIIIEDSVLTAEVLKKTFQKIGHGFVNYRP